MSVNFIMYQNRNRTNIELIYFEFYLEIFKYSPFHTWPYIYKLIYLWAKNKTLWFWQNNYILCPVCVSSPPEFFPSRQSHNVTILYNACWREEEVCHSYMPRGPGYQRYDIRAEARQTKTQEKICCYQSSKCQGCSPATTINQLMGWFIPMVAMFLSFPKVYFWVGVRGEGGCEGQLLLGKREGLWQLGYILSVHVDNGASRTAKTIVQVQVQWGQLVFHGRAHIIEIIHFVTHIMSLPKPSQADKLIPHDITLCIFILSVPHFYL